MTTIDFPTRNTQLPKRNARRTAEATRDSPMRRFARWIARANERRALATLDDRLLRDIGVTREVARRECAKPFSF